MFVVEVKAIGGYTLHSTHRRYRDAVDQADMVHGRVVMTIEITLAHLLREYSPEIVRDVVGMVQLSSVEVVAEFLSKFVIANDVHVHVYCIQRGLVRECEIIERYMSDIVWTEVVECLLGE